MLGIHRKEYPGERDACVGIPVRQLEKFETDGPLLNAFLISGLIDIDATEAIGLIRHAFSRDRVDLSIVGDIEEVEIEMGLRTRRSTPRPRFDLLDRALESNGLADPGIDDPLFGYPRPGLSRRWVETSRAPAEAPRNTRNAAGTESPRWVNPLGLAAVHAGKNAAARQQTYGHVPRT